MRIGHEALPWSRKENKYLEILLNLFKIKRLEQVLEPTHESFVRVLCRPPSEIGFMHWKWVSRHKHGQGEKQWS